MARCRVYERADGTLAVVHPAPNSRHPDESEADWYARVMARTEATDPSLQGRPFHDCDPSDLPDRKDRKDWKVKDGRVKVEKS